jgi:hypothetical protein
MLGLTAMPHDAERLVEGLLQAAGVLAIARSAMMLKLADVAGPVPVL